MPIRTLKSVSPGRRLVSILTYEELTRAKPDKSLTKRLKKCAGRNNQGKLTIRHQGGGNKKLYRLVDFKQTGKIGIGGKVKSIEYDPYRSAFIMLVVYADSEKRYHLAPHGIKVNDTVITKEKAKVKVGNRMMLKNIPPGFEIYNLELTPGKGGQIVRSAGSSAKLVSLEGTYAQVELPSKEIRFVNKNCFASIGRVSNLDYFNVSLGKAGRSRHRGKRPSVRGKVMNPIDHPHGGGEGKNPIGHPGPLTPWGMPALGFKTRKRKRFSNKYIVRTRKGKQLIKIT